MKAKICFSLCRSFDKHKVCSCASSVDHCSLSWLVGLCFKNSICIELNLKDWINNGDNVIGVVFSFFWGHLPMRWPPIWWLFPWRPASERPAAGSPFSFWQNGSWCAWLGCRSSWPHNCSWGTGRWVFRWWSGTRTVDGDWDSCESCTTCRTDRRRADTRLVRNLQCRCGCGAEIGAHEDGWVSEWVKVIELNLVGLLI